MKNTRYTTEFGASVSRALADASMTQTTLASAIGQSKTYVNQVIVGRRNPSPEWVDLVARAINLKDEERVKLHRRAAIQNGFKLDLSSPRTS